jgi:molybdopterin-guanine dinucleotide biosynthesis protein A
VPGLKFVYDEIRDIGPLAGVQASLKAARGEYVAIVACDMPFLSGRAIGLLFEKAEGHDAAVPVQKNGFLEPLHAVYRREPMLRAVERSIGRNESRISAPLSHLEDVAFVPVEELEKADPGLRTLLNVNRAEDLPQ